MPTYHPLVYKTSGGDTLNVAAGGELQIGGTAFITSGGGVALGTLTTGIVAFPAAVTFTGSIYADGGYHDYLETATSSWTALTYNYGVSVVVGSSGAPVTYALPAPSSGVHKFIVCVHATAGTATGAAIITSSGASATVSAGYTSILLTTGAVVNQWVHLIGQNTTNWLLAGNSTDVSFSAT